VLVYQNDRLLGDKSIILIKAINWLIGQVLVQQHEMKIFLLGCKNETRNLGHL